MCESAGGGIERRFDGRDVLSGGVGELEGVEADGRDGAGVGEGGGVDGVDENRVDLETGDVRCWSRCFVRGWINEEKGLSWWNGGFETRRDPRHPWLMRCERGHGPMGREHCLISSS